MNKPDLIWKIKKSHGPIIASAIHDGHDLRKEVAEIMSLDDSTQLREEDPFTGFWTVVGDTQIVGLRSRFEVDLNRPREKAVYIKPEDAWGLEVWKVEPNQEIINRSLAEYDAFYSEMFSLFSEMEKLYGSFVVYDLHTYCYRRGGPDAPEDDPELNPEVNIGTGTINREHWGSLLDKFMDDLKNYNYNGRKLDVRENIKFKGGNFSRWIHQNFPETACSISIEFKKFFMDEWTGKPYPNQLEEIKSALQATIPGVLEELKKVGAQW
jgi:N-formylglutamate deformylase